PELSLPELAAMLGAPEKKLNRLDRNPESWIATIGPRRAGHRGPIIPFVASVPGRSTRWARPLPALGSSAVDHPIDPLAEKIVSLGRGAFGRCRCGGAQSCPSSVRPCSASLHLLGGGGS